jgi:hypothetical protein
MLLRAMCKEKKNAGIEITRMFNNSGAEVVRAQYMEVTLGLSVF